ncbi:type II DNA modification methyltransferase [Streptococcus pneumoniae]|nr:type II DNA modification methyltransferase [Streptococcus pneumoniae]COK43775.1 type II DNA modification methyltransferase [Streptococcus pneumoniae]
MKFLDLFAGIGGFRLGMESAGHECIGFCEIDKFARASYKAIHDTKGEIELHDITTVSDDTIRGIGSVDVICGGFPCQAFSIAGNRRGFKDTRGTLFFEIARFASILRPKYLFLENVKGLLNHENGVTFETIISTLDELGYNVEWQVLNSKNFGVPQNRERVFIIGHLRRERTRRIFPLSGKNQSTSNQSVMKIGNINPSGNGMNGEVYQADGLAPTLTTNKGEGQKIAINSYHENNHLSDGFRIRKLTPKECWRLQGFPDWTFDKAQEVNSNSQLYKQAGNSVTVNVIAAIAKELS